MRHTGDDDDDDENVGQKRYITKEEGTVVQEHSKSNFDPTPNAQLDLIRPIAHLTSTTTRPQREHGTIYRTRAQEQLEYRPLLEPSRTIMTCSISLQLATIQTACGTWLSEAVPPKRA